MYVFLLVICILAVLTAVVFFEPLRILFVFDTDKPDMVVIARWIPFIVVDVQLKNARPFVTVRMFNKRVFARCLKSGKGKPHVSPFGSLALSDTRLSIAWGFREPYLTGLFCAAADFAGALIRAADLELEPDFVPENEFIRLRARTALNIGRTLVNMARAKLGNKEGSRKYGSTQYE